MKRLFLTLISLLVAHTSLAQSQFGDWFVISADDKSGDVIAATGTDGKELLGYRCFIADSVCRYVLLSNVTCDAGGRYPMLLNAEAGSALVTGHCHKNNATDQLLLQPYKPIEEALQAGGTGMLGFAIPMASGAFKAVRFSIKGGGSAILEAERRAEERRRAASNRPVKPGATTF
jgi:hypothetical protein